MCHFWCFQMELLIGGNREILSFLIHFPSLLLMVSSSIQKQLHCPGSVTVNSKELLSVTLEL